MKIKNDMKNNFEDELKKIRYKEERIITEMNALNDYKREVLRKITETQGWENVLNHPYKSIYTDNVESLLSDTTIVINVDKKDILRVYDGEPGYLDTHEILSFNLHNSIDEEMEYRRKEQEYFDELAKMSSCGKWGI